MTTGVQLLVGMADIQVHKGSALFTCLGLGSCIGLAALDPESNVAGMVHVMLPESFKDKPVEKPGKFADTGIRELLDQMRKIGADPTRLRIAYAGGAQVFKFGSNADSRLDVGARNGVAVEQMVRSLGFRPVAVDVGGSVGRTVMFASETGEVRVRTVAGGERVLCKLR